MPGSTPCSMSSRPAAPAAATAAVPRPAASSRRGSARHRAASGARCQPRQRDAITAAATSIARAGTGPGPAPARPSCAGQEDGRPGRGRLASRPWWRSTPRRQVEGAPAGQPGGRPGQRGRADRRPGDLHRREGRRRGLDAPSRTSPTASRPSRRRPPAAPTTLRPRCPADPASRWPCPPDDQHQQADRDQQQPGPVGTRPTPGQPPAHRGPPARPGPGRTAAPGHHHGAHRGGPGAGRGPLPADQQLRPHPVGGEEDGQRAAERGQAGPGLVALGQPLAAQPGLAQPGQRAADRDVGCAPPAARPFGQVGDEQFGELRPVPHPPASRIPANQPRRTLCCRLPSSLGRSFLAPAPAARAFGAGNSRQPPAPGQAAQAHVGHLALGLQVFLQGGGAGRGELGRAAAGRCWAAPRSCPGLRAGSAPRTACRGRAAPRRNCRCPWSARSRAWPRRPGWTGSAWPGRRTGRTCSACQACPAHYIGIRSIVNRSSSQAKHHVT